MSSNKYKKGKLTGELSRHMSERNLTKRRSPIMATTAERLGIVETKVQNLDEKLDHMSEHVKNNHVEIKEQLKSMYDASCSQHAELNQKITELEKFRNKWGYMVAGAVAVLGIMAGHFDKIEKFFS